MEISIREQAREITIRLCAHPRVVEIMQMSNTISGKRRKLDYITIPKAEFDKFLAEYHEDEKKLID